MVRITKQPEDRRNEILDIAERLFIKNGFDQTPVSDIVYEAKVAKGTFYYYFKSKDEILDSILIRAVDHFIAEAQKIVEDKNLNAAEKFMEIFKSRISVIKGKENLSAYIHKPENYIIRHKLESKLAEKHLPMLEKIIKQGIEEKIFKTEYPRAAAEFWLVAMAHFAIHIMLKYKDPEILMENLKALDDFINKILGAENRTISIYKFFNEQMLQKILKARKNDK